MQTRVHTWRSVVAPLIRTDSRLGVVFSVTTIETVSPTHSDCVRAIQRRQSVLSDEILAQQLSLSVDWWRQTRTPPPTAACRDCVCLIATAAFEAQRSASVAISLRLVTLLWDLECNASFYRASSYMYIFIFISEKAGSNKEQTCYIHVDYRQHVKH